MLSLALGHRKLFKDVTMTKITIICGGPSAERGISLNSARSIYDHLKADGVQFNVLYVDTFLNFYSIRTSKLYSNTPSDFDFELANKGHKLKDDDLNKALIDCDIVFPCIHGEFGEDGQLQQILENLNINFVGSGSVACSKALNKYKINQILQKAELPALKIMQLDLNKDNSGRISEFEQLFNASPSGQLIVKPVSGGSSLGVEIVTTALEILDHCKYLKQQYGTKQAVVEEYCKGKEFTVVVIESATGEPVALPITEVDVEGKFDYRKKYLATEATKRHCPPRTYSDAQIDKIRQQAETIFKIFGMRDMARFDGFLTSDDTLYFNDLNPISGMEQNSFFFQQICRVGWRHKDLLRHVVNLALTRGNKPILPEPKSSASEKQPVFVLFGGNSGEKEVSVMSGTNVWLKLAQSDCYAPSPFLLTGETVWKLPYAFCLDHTVSEIVENCENALLMKSRVARLASDIQKRLDISQPVSTWHIPQKLALSEFLNHAQESDAFVFLGLHGGDGENGILQEKLDALRVNYNGPGPDSARLCMDKYRSGQKIIHADLDKITAAPKLKIDISDKDEFKGSDKAHQLFKDGLKLWQNFQTLTGQDVSDFETPDLLVKPKSDGCSLGIVRLKNSDELGTYFRHMGDNSPLAGNTFAAHEGIIEMNFDPTNGLIIEPFIETVKLRVENHEIIPQKVAGWIELTVGVVFQESQLHALVPSITVAENSVLSLEEKFQGGTGVNLTPPPEHIVSKAQCLLIQRQIEKIAVTLNIDGYARIDVFFNTISEHLIFIEANTLPGLTPSTVIYHQALADTPSRNPTEFLQHLIQTKIHNKHFSPDRQHLWTATEIAQAVNGEVIGTPFTVSGISIDSRLTQPGDLFFALGEGYKFVDGALALGAVGSISSHAVAEPYIKVDDTQKALESLAVMARMRSQSARRIAVTGSVGKTCVTQAIARVLASAGTVHRPVSSYNNHVGVPVTLCRMPKETDFGIFELGMNNPKEISALTRFVQPDIAIITKIGNAHTANFTDGLKGIAKAKAEIFEGLSQGGTAIINKDTEWFELLCDMANAQKAIVRTFSLNQKADAQLLSYKENPSGAELSVLLDGDIIDFSLAQHGKHWAENCLSILLVVKALNIPLAPAIYHLSKIEALTGRGETHKLSIESNTDIDSVDILENKNTFEPNNSYVSKVVTLIDDSYNANPDSMIAALENLKIYPGGKRRIAILTDMLEQKDALQLHRDLAPHIVAASIDKVFLCGKNMKSLYETLPDSLRGEWRLSHEELLPSILANIQSDDVILVKGSNGSGANNIVRALKDVSNANN